MFVFEPLVLHLGEDLPAQVSIVAGNSLTNLRQAIFAAWLQVLAHATSKLGRS